MFIFSVNNIAFDTHYFLGSFLTGRFNSLYMESLFRDVYLSQEPNSRKRQNFGLPYMILAQRFGTFFKKNVNIYILVSSLQNRWVYNI